MISRFEPNQRGWSIKGYLAVMMMACCLCWMIPVSGSAAQELRTRTKSHNQAGTTSTEQTGENAPPPPVIAHIHLEGELTEKPGEDPFKLSGEESTSLEDLLQKLDKIRQDNSVKAVLLSFDDMEMGLGQLEELRNALMQLKESKKQVLVHTESMDTKYYALLSIASKLSLEPQSELWLTGIYTEAPYLKTLLDKIGVEADIIHIGDYKSAGEALTQTGPSAAAQQNINWLLDGLYDSLVHMIAQARSLKPEQIRQLTDAGPYRADQAVKKGLADSLTSRETFLSQLRKQYGNRLVINNRYGEKDKSKSGLSTSFANPFGFFSSIFNEMASQRKNTGKPAVALIYAEGMIESGYEQSSPFSRSSGVFSGNIRKALEDAVKDDGVKAIVLRVDSPGGSAEASDIILEATQRVKGHKPLIVSMGNVAASGGYYISCAADTIFADEMTITGSIGVVGGKLVTTGLWNKLGVNWVAQKRGANAGLMASDHPFEGPQRTRIEDLMQATYKQFKDHVTQGRGDRLKKPIDEIAGGRVYTGKQALALGLVDRIGGLNEALDFAAGRASLNTYEVKIIPEPKDILTELIESLSGKEARPSDVEVTGGTPLIDFKSPLYQSALPLLRQLDPRRCTAFLQALGRLELIRREKVALMMPESLMIK